MRARPLTLLTALAAVTLVVVAGCEARVEAEAYSAADRISSRPQARPQPQPVELLLRAITPPRAPAASPNVGFGELPTRVRQATDEAAAMGATLSVAVLDRATGQLVSNGNTQIIATASVAKLFIADDLLLAEAEGKVTLSPEDHHALDVMLQSSDDGAAERFWSQAAAMPSSLKSRADMGSGRRASQRRALVEHNQLRARPDPLLRHAARRVRRPTTGSGRRHHRRPGPVHTDRDRRLPAAVRHPRRFVRRTGRSQTGLDVLYRQQLDASVHRGDRPGTPLHHGDRVTAARRRRHRSSNHHASRQNDVSQRPDLTLVRSPHRREQTQKPPHVRRVGGFRVCSPAGLVGVGQVGASFAGALQRDLSAPGGNSGMVAGE